jgi:hypothetical protein
MDVAATVIGRRKGFKPPLVLRRAIQVQCAGDQLRDGFRQPIHDLARELESMLGCAAPARLARGTRGSGASQPSGKRPSRMRSSKRRLSGLKAATRLVQAVVRQAAPADGLPRREDTLGHLELRVRPAEMA